MSHEEEGVEGCSFSDSSRLWESSFSPPIRAPRLRRFVLWTSSFATVSEVSPLTWEWSWLDIPPLIDKSNLRIHKTQIIRDLLIIRRGEALSLHWSYSNSKLELTLIAELGFDFGGSGLQGRWKMRRRGHSTASRWPSPREERRQRASVSIRSGVWLGLRDPFARQNKLLTLWLRDRDSFWERLTDAQTGLQNPWKRGSSWIGAFSSPVNLPMRSIR